MTNLILTIIIVGAAVTYLIEFIDSVSQGLVDSSFLKKWFSIPLSLGGMWVMNPHWTLTLLVTVPATIFVSLMLLKILNKPVQVSYQRLPRL